MGQKVNPHGLRVGVIKDWDSRWYARNEKVGDLVVEDYNLRKYLKKTLYSAGIPKIEIERDNAKIKIYLHCARPAVITGKDKGQRGKVLSVNPKEGKVVVEKINLVSRHTRPRKQGEEGGILQKEAPLYACKVMRVCPKCDKTTRAASKIVDGKKVRVCKHCGAEI